jgi:hypothetical protein
MKTKYVVKAKKLWKEADRIVVQEAVEYAIDKFDLEGYGKLIVKMNYTQDLFGSAFSMDEETHYVFISAKQSKEATLKTIFHEMWHIYQYIYEGLDLEKNEASFKGKKWKFNDIEQSYDEYYKLPWEVAARKMEQKTYKAYSKRKKVLDK